MSNISNRNLHIANGTRKDEYYTQLSDIEKELKHYRGQFRGKTVYCNCDDPYESNFFKYFAANFNALGLKKLITTSYIESPVAGKQLPLFRMKGLESIKPKNAKPHRIEINKVIDFNNDGAIDLEDIKKLLEDKANVSTPLSGDGDFRSIECIKLLEESDIVCTNPPFSLFREYVAQLIEYNKKFLIIGNYNAITYKEIFPLFKDNKIWIGYSPRSMNFQIPKGGLKKVNACWYTNLDVIKRHENIILYKKYLAKEYPRYDNYDAINVDKVSDIPIDYYDAMGVPITFIERYNPDQFEIIKFRKGDDERDLLINGKSPYFRILIKRKT